MVDVAGATMGGFLTGRGIAEQEEKRKYFDEDRAEAREIRKEERGYLLSQRSKKSAREEAVAAKAQRLQGFLGQEGITEQQRESLVAGEDIDMANKMRDFRTEGEAKNADLNASDAAVVMQAIGTDNEKNAVLWFSGELEKRGAPHEQVAEAMQQYDNAPPEQRSAIAERFMQGFLSRGMGAKDYLASKRATDKRLPAGGIEKVSMPDGSTTSFDLTNPEQRRDYQDAIAAGGTDVPTISKQIQGTPADFSTNKISDEMAQAESATSIYIQDIYDAQDFVKNNPGALTDVSKLASIGTNIMANVKTLMRDFDVDLENDNVLDAEAYVDTFEDLGIASVQMQSMVRSLAAQQAIINNPGGRISDRDIKEAIVIIGASIQTPKGFIKVTDRLAKRADRVFRTRYKARSKNRTEFKGSLGLRGAEKAKGEDKESIVTVASQEQFNSLPIGAIYIDSSGKKQSKD